MRRAIEAARRGWGATHPNPVVGAVLAIGDRLLAEGYHARVGTPHAEAAALGAWSAPVPPEATLYVTLEPCSTTGRTPPCTGAILARGVRRVVVGAVDDDPRHRGAGLDRLREAGVEVVAGVLEPECRDLNLVFSFRQRTGNPMVAAKIATTIDGRTATAAGASRWITGAAARRDVHRWRRYFPAIGVGAGTVLADDPALTAREEEAVHCPERLVFDRRGLLAGAAGRRVFSDSFRDRTTVFAGPGTSDLLRKALPADVGVETIPESESFAAYLRGWLARRDLGGLFVEGGRGLLSSLFAERAVDYLFAYRAPKLFLDESAKPVATGFAPADPAAALSLEGIRLESFGDDQLVRGYVRYPESPPPRENG